MSTLPAAATEQAGASRWPSILLIAGAGIVAWGAFLPWASIFAGLDPLFGINGTNGKILLGAAAVLAVVGSVAALRPSRVLLLLGGWVAVLIAVFAVVLLANLVGAYRGDAGSIALLRLGPGLFVAESGALLAASVLALPSLSGMRSTSSAVMHAPAPLRIAAAVTLGAGLIHLAVVGDHFHESDLFGWFFLAAGVVQFALFAGLWHGGSRQVILFALVVNGVLVVLWAISRTVGLPVGPEPWRPEDAGLLDIVATTYEVIAAFALIWALRPHAERPTDHPERTTDVLVTVFGASLVGVAIALSLVELGTFG